MRSRETDLLRQYANLPPASGGALQFRPLPGHQLEVCLDTALRPDLTVAVRMAPGKQPSQDYYPFPASTWAMRCVAPGASTTACRLDAYRDSMTCPPFTPYGDTTLGEGCRMNTARPAQRVEWIPPRAHHRRQLRVRNKRTFKEIVDNIAQVGPSSARSPSRAGGRRTAPSTISSAVRGRLRSPGAPGRQRCARPCRNGLTRKIA